LKYRLLVHPPSLMIEIKIPAVGESITSGVIAAFHKKSGDYVKANEPILTLDTDKVSTEIVAETGGVLSLIANEGDEVKIGQVVATLDPSAPAPAGAPAAAATSAAPAAAPASDAPIASPKATEPAKPAAGADLSPAVRRLVEEENVDANGVTGTGKGGRLTKGDVLAHVENRGSAPSPTPGPSVNPQSEIRNLQSSAERITRHKISPLRKKIAAHLVNAQHTAAILTTFNECDMSTVMALRSKVQDAFVKKHGVKLGFMSFFIKAVVDALKHVPAINGQMEGDDIFIQNHFYDIGVAVGTEKGLVVPVLRDCDTRSFAGIEQDIAAYAKKAREGKLQISDLTGGVFTVSNGGTYGSLMGTPILNPPQSGILGMHAIVQRPVAVDGKIEIRPMMYLALSYDHRVVDGKEAVTFLVRLKQSIEDPTRLLFEL
jgi:2-oxoglutarate dehydrogenase E2 component (dihydrolipoamide succinyltransferase)